MSQELSTIIDFIRLGASRFNAPQIRLTPNNPEVKLLADAFNAPFTPCWCERLARTHR